MSNHLSISELTESVADTLEKMMPHLLRAEEAMTGMYPPDTTPAEVINAVTIPMPLRHFIALITVSALFLKQHRPDGVMKSFGEPDAVETTNEETIQ